MIDEIRREAARAVASVARIVRRGILKSLNAVPLAQGEGFAGETFDAAEFFQHWGFASSPPEGAEALFALIDGEGVHPIAFATHVRGDRPTLATGDAALFGAKSGSQQAQVITRADGTVEITPAAGKFAECGGSDELMLLGETVKGDLATFAGAVAAAAPFEAGVKAAAAALATASASWLASNAKVK